MLTIYHNPRCRKSREGLAILEDSGKEFQTRLYLKEPLSKAELKSLVQQLGIAAIDLVRTNEKVWKSDYKGKDLSEGEVLDAMLANPVLIERPVVSDGRKAVIGRPPENISDFLE